MESEFVGEKGVEEFKKWMKDMGFTDEAVEATRLVLNALETLRKRCERLRKAVAKSDARENMKSSYKNILRAEIFARTTNAIDDRSLSMRQFLAVVRNDDVMHY